LASVVTIVKGNRFSLQLEVASAETVLANWPV
jgi:hypothetical protein